MNRHPGLRFRRTQRTALGVGLCISVGVHALLLWNGRLPLVPSPRVELATRDFRVVGDPPVTEIPPPPEPIRRPAEPRVPEVRVDALALDSSRVAPLVEVASPPRPAWPSPDPWSATARGIPPLLEASTTFTRRIERHYPRGLQAARIEGAVELELLVDSDGRVDRARIRESSGHPRLDEAAERVAFELRFLPALARDRFVEVWVSQRICFALAHPRRSRSSPDACEPREAGSR